MNIFKEIQGILLS